MTSKHHARTTADIIAAATGQALTWTARTAYDPYNPQHGIIRNTMLDQRRAGIADARDRAGLYDLETIAREYDHASTALIVVTERSHPEPAVSYITGYMAGLTIAYNDLDRWYPDPR